LNPYVSRLGLGLLSQYDTAAARALATLYASTPGIAGLVPTLADDLRLCRWSHLPVVSHLMIDRFRAIGDGPETFAASYPLGWTVRNMAAVAAWHGKQLHVFFSPVGGGMVRVFCGRELILEDAAPWLDRPDGRWGVAGYDPGRSLLIEPDGCGLRTQLAKSIFFFPGFLSRLILRIGSINRYTSRILRSLIDSYRMWRHTAINQSAAPMAKTDGLYSLERWVRARNSQVEIVDELRAYSGTIDLNWLVATYQYQGVTQNIAKEVGAFRSFRIVKSLFYADGKVECTAAMQSGQ